MKQNSFIKVYWILPVFEVERDSLYKQKINIFRYQTTNLLKIWILFLAFTKGQNRDESQLVTKFVGIIVTIDLIKSYNWFSKKYLSNS